MEQMRMSEVVAETGISRRTLVALVAGGHLPRPVMTLGETGRGRSGLYPGWVPEFVREFLRLRKEGYPMDEAADIARARVAPRATLIKGTEREDLVAPEGGPDEVTY